MNKREYEDDLRRRHREYSIEDDPTGAKGQGLAEEYFRLKGSFEGYKEWLKPDQERMTPLEKPSLDMHLEDFVNTHNLNGINWNELEGTLNNIEYKAKVERTNKGKWIPILFSSLNKKGYPISDNSRYLKNGHLTGLYKEVKDHIRYKAERNRRGNIR